MVTLKTTSPPTVSAIGETTDTRNVMADIYLDGRYYTTENGAPYTFPWDNATQRYGAGTHRVEFIFKLQDTTTEIGRSSITVQEGP